MSFKKNPPPVRYTNAAFPPLDERLCTPKAEPATDVESVPSFGYTVAFACRMETFRQYVSPYLSLQLKKTEEEAAIRQWDEKPQGQHTYVACDVRTAEEKSLAVRWYSNPSTMLAIDAVEPHEACSVVVKEAFVPVRPAIRMGEQLGLPTEGYLYHFLEGQLVSEFRCMGDTYPRFQVTQSRPEAMYPEPAVDRPLEYILALWQRNGQVIQDQYLLYSREALSDKAIQSVDTAFLQAHGVRLDMDQIIPLTENSGQRKKHTVVEGETLSEVAEKHQLTFETLLALNPYWRGKETRLTNGIKLYLEPVGIYNHGQDVSYPVSAALLGDGVFAIEPSKKRADFPVVQVAESDGARLTALSPVRYALDACNAQGQGLHPIPDTETFSGGIFQADDTPYTLRQLRDGWLYALSPVPDSESWTLEEYKIEQGEFRRVIGQTAEARQKAEPGRPKTHILCVSDRPYYLAYAVKRWTDRICDYYLGNAEARDGWLRQVNLNTSGAATHRTDVADVECYVADVNAQAQERFAGTCAPLSGDVDRPNDFIHIPPKKTLASYTYQAPSAYVQQIVALDDPLADLSDLFLALLEPVLITTPDESTHRKVVVAEAIRSMVRVPIPKDKMPEIQPEQWVEFESALDVCLEYEYQKVHLPQLGSDNMMPQRLKDLEACRQASLKAQATLEGMGFFGVEEYVQDYTDRRKAHSQVNWDDLDAFYKDYLASQSHAYAAIPGAFDRLLTAIPKLGTEPMHLGLDILYSDHMGYLMELFGEILPALNCSANDEAMQQKLADALIQEKPDNLMALATSFFSAEFYAKADELVKESDVIDLQRESVPVTGVVAGLNSVLGYGQAEAGGLYQKTLSMMVPISGLIDSATEAMKNIIGMGYQKGYFTYFGMMMNQGGFRAGFNVAAMIWCIEQISQGKIGMNPAFEGTSRAYRQRLTGAALEWQSLENQLKRMPADSPNRAELKMKQEKMEARAGQMVRQAPVLFESFNGEKLQPVNQFFDRVNQSLNRIGRMDFVVAFLNSMNVVVQQYTVEEALSSNPNVDLNTQLHVVGFSTAWLMHATSEIFRGLAFERVKQKPVMLEKKLNDLALKSRNLDIRLLAKGYLQRSMLSGMLGVIAAGWEAYRTLLDAGKADFRLEKGLLYLKSAVLFTQSGVWGVLALNGARGLANRAVIGFVLQGWMVAAWFWLGIAYLVISIIINMLQKSPLENWLRKSIWGKEPKGDWTAKAEYQALLQILNQPQIQEIVKSCKQLPGKFASPYEPSPFTTLKQLKITFPQQRPGQSVSVGVTVSGLREQEGYLGYRKTTKVEAFTYQLTALDIARGYWEYDVQKVPTLVLDVPIWIEAVDTIQIFAMVSNHNPFSETEKTAQYYKYQLNSQIKRDIEVMKDGKASDMIGHQLFSVKIEES
ncbi:LysM peptidoglycan-binding domain-containing protein [Photobacterium sp. 1_MG-2023]|uniref:LysM peptidoglycan-binding domain-containing protein n=1 Tax=Photobacterium sp. 1_MG-2023 TaxID=3062646 RepID=UPI0026E2EB47|nr:LysM peptidoglycan-binding domain-containing protein [Photobacterium sp. 1_MG-2023]MDO6707281.1 LysM peptidoglycan-binding domain-containing protein [Photobacterium sp. 1_MG-2023]